MLKDIILQQKIEKDKLAAKSYVQRENLAEAQKYLESDLVKVVTGPRRAGKSVFCLELLKNYNFAYLNFEDENLLKVDNYDDIIQSLAEVYPQANYYLFDEIQNLPNWETFINKLHRRGYKIIITGSNSRLLSKELGTSLTGRFIAFEVLPFSFREYLIAKGYSPNLDDYRVPETKGQLQNELSSYLASGGYPEIVTSSLDVKNYLETLFDSIILTDVVKRFKIRFSRQVYDLATYLVSNYACETSFNRLVSSLEFKSVNTVKKYFSYLEESYLIFAINRYSTKLKEQTRAPQKVFVTDNGLIDAKAFSTSKNTGRLMENIVAIQFLRKGKRPDYELFYYKSHTGKEVDFALRQDNKITELVQVCFDTSDLKTRKREINSLVEAAKTLEVSNLKIITWDEESEKNISESKISFVPLWKWLLIQ